MIKIWKLYELPILLVATVNWLILFALTDTSVFIAFWWIVLFFSLQSLLFSWILTYLQYKLPSNFFSGFAVAKAAKFFLSVAFLLLLSVIYPDEVLNCCITAGVLFLITLIVDTGLLLRFVQRLKKEVV